MDDEEPVVVYRRWIETFGNKINTLSPEDWQTPFRPSSSTLVSLEFEGECLEWTRRYLSLHDCPNGLVYQLSRDVYKSVKAAVNLSRFAIDAGDEEEDASDSASQGSSDELDGPRVIPPQQLLAGKLLIEVVSHIHNVVRAWNSSPPTLVPPPTTLHVCSHAIKNTRRKMEDRHVTITDLNTLYDFKDCPTQSYFAVFDGHGGTEAADYAAAQLHNFLLSDVNFNSDPASAMKRAYKMTDTRFLEKAKRQGLRSGTTGVSVLVRGDELHLAWLGDSQALLVRSGHPVQVMDPHKPEREDERKRIEELGGCVLFFGAWRVNGNIAVARAIGDAAHKPYISSDADVTSLRMTGEEEYLVLACDGLWDVLTPSQVTHIVYKHSHTSPGGLNDVAIGLVNAARDAGSSDNISVVVILFKSKLSVPQSGADSGMLLGMVRPEGEVEDPSTSSGGGSIPPPKPPTLNRKLESRTQGDGKDDLAPSVVSCAGGNANALSSAVLQTPFTHKLVRQGGFIVNTPRGVHISSRQRDANLVRLALRQAASSAENKSRLSRKHKSNQGVEDMAGGMQANYAKKKEVRDVRRPKARSLSRQPSQQRSSMGGYSKMKKTSSNGLLSFSLALAGPGGETQWGGHSDDSDDAWSVSTGLSEERSARHPGAASHNQDLPLAGKRGDHLNPIRLKGSSLLQAAIAVEASTTSQWARNMSPFLQLAGTTLPLSNRATLPQILPCMPSSSKIGRLSGSYGNLSKISGQHKGSSNNHHPVAVVPPLWGPGRQLSSLGEGLGHDPDAKSVYGDSMSRPAPGLGTRKLSVLSDTGLSRSRHPRHRSGSFKDVSRPLETRRRPR